MTKVELSKELENPYLDKETEEYQERVRLHREEELKLLEFTCTKAFFTSLVTADPKACATPECLNDAWDKAGIYARYVLDKAHNSELQIPLTMLE